MQVTKNMYDLALRKYYYPLKWITKCVTKKWCIRFMNWLVRHIKGKKIDSLLCEERTIPSKSGGPDIRIRIFRPKNTSSHLPAMLYCHGGGYMLGVPEISLKVMRQFIETRPCVIVAPDYRKSIDDPYPAGFNDCYDTLLWMKENADTLGILPSKFIVAGHSAGGGLTAAITLKARDTKDIEIAFQMPIYPMLDHRQESASAKNMVDIPLWNSKTNAFGWNLYLQQIKGTPPTYASPALNTNYKDFPPTITFVGGLEVFKDETIHYVEALKKENIPVKFELFEGAFHAFEVIAKKSAIGRKANAFQMQSFAEYMDTYVNRT